MLKKLFAKRNALIEELKSLTGAEEWTEETSAKFEAKKTELNSVKSQIVAAQEVAGLGIDPEGEEVPQEEPAGDEPQARSKVKSAITISKPKAPASEFRSLDEFLFVVGLGKSDRRLDDCYTEYRSEQSMGTGSKGGFMVPTQLLMEAKSKAAAPALVRPRATVIPAGSPPDAEILVNALDQNPTAGGTQQVFAGVNVYKVEEGGEKTETDYNLNQISLKPAEVAARITLTDKLLRNWTAGASLASSLLINAMGAFEDTQFLLGNGIGGPEGVIPANYSYKVNRAVANQIAFADIKKMYGRFLGNPANAVWVASYAAYEYMLNMVSDGSGNTNIIRVDAVGAVSMYGIPVVRHPRLSALGTRGDLILADFSEYLIKDGSGPIVEFGYASGQWERNKQSIKVTWNVDGRGWLTKPYKQEEGYECSSVVVLTVPA